MLIIVLSVHFWVLLAYLTCLLYYLWLCIILLWMFYFLELSVYLCHRYVSLSCTGPMELKTPALSARCIYLFTYSLRLVDMGIQGDTHGLLIHWQMAETSVNKGLSEKETLRKGLCNNKNNYKSTLTNINETLN